jgi:hypothetical protein
MNNKLDILDKIEIQEKINETLEFLNDDELCENAIKTAGWNKSSVEKFSQSIGLDKDAAEHHGFIDKCIMHMENKSGFDKKKAGGFCSSLVDTYKGNTNWRKGNR